MLNRIGTTKKGMKYRMVAQFLDEGTKPTDLIVVTFNQDLQIENVFQELQYTG